VVDFYPEQFENVHPSTCFKIFSPDMDSSESLRIDRFDHDPKKLKLEEVFQKKTNIWSIYSCKCFRLTSIYLQVHVRTLNIRGKNLYILPAAPAITCFGRRSWAVARRIYAVARRIYAPVRILQCVTNLRSAGPAPHAAKQGNQVVRRCQEARKFHSNQYTCVIEAINQ